MVKMMTILVINCGTSSVKMTLFSHDLKHRLIEGHLKHLFSSHPILEINGKTPLIAPPPSYTAAIMILIEYFEKEGFNSSSLVKVGHRIVHGGNKYIQSTVITSVVEKELQDLSQLAPLHNPPAMEGIKCIQHLFPHILQIAVFDTAFHTTVPQKAALYPIPYDLSQMYGIKRYGFHGIAHAFSWKKYLDSFGKKNGQNKIITVHLGSGSSVTAIDNGISVDTSMGFTPLDGIMMATRSGELDPSIVAFLCDKEEKSPSEIIDILNHKSGLLGIFGKTGDIQEILKNAASDPKAKLALDMYAYRILKKIGSFIAVLGYVDAIIFSGGVGENAAEIRLRLSAALSWYSVLIDEKKNEECTHLSFGEIRCINKLNSKVLLCVVSTDENLFIAEEISQVRSHG